MISIATHRQLQEVQKLPFCYFCGILFRDDEKRSRDHVPPKACFAMSDRANPLILPSHPECNSQRSVTDTQIGQLIGLKHGKVPKERRGCALKMQFFGSQVAAVTNVDVRDEIWRWIWGFHAALYHEAFTKDARCALETPFPSASLGVGRRVQLDPIKQQHEPFVSRIKINRAKSNLDTIRCNKGKLTYDCVWCQSDDRSAWICIFAIDIYGWKDLGNQVIQPARGCVGCYMLPDGCAPPNAAREVTSSITIPNSDQLDPFGQ